MPSVTFGSVHPSDVLDMPVDPNEDPPIAFVTRSPTGEMIGCDNPDVKTVCLRSGALGDRKGVGYQKRGKG